MSKRFLKMQVGLLLAEYGLDAVLEAVAGTSGEDLGDLEKAVATLAGRKKMSRSSSRRDAASVEDQILAERPDLRRLVDSYRAKQFLPTLKDVRAFLHDHGSERTVNRRSDALPVLIEALSLLPPDRIKGLEEGLGPHRDPGAFVALANEVMRGQQGE